MNKRPVLFLDSGIGGIPYCRHFRARNPGEDIVYAADHLHFPYGTRGKEELVSIVHSLLERLVVLYDPKMAVLACNTATISALDPLRDFFPDLPFVGTVPAVKPAVMESRTRVVGVLGTERTVEDSYITGLAARYGPDCRIAAVAAPDLVDFVEKRCIHAGASEKHEAVFPYIRRFRGEGADAVVLGCTHFLFLREEFRNEAAPDITIYDSVAGISGRIETLLDEKGIRSPHAAGKGVLVVSGGESSGDIWRVRADHLGFALSFLEQERT
jgi:glutamate racemase